MLKSEISQAEGKQIIKWTSMKNNLTTDRNMSSQRSKNKKLVISGMRNA